MNSIPSRCTRSDNEHHVCNCGCTSYERDIARLTTENVQLEQQLDQMKREVEAVIKNIPPEFVVRVREGGGAEGLCATLAVSVANLVRKLQPPITIRVGGQVVAQLDKIEVKK